MTGKYCSIIQNSTEGERDPAASLNHPSLGPVRFAGRDSVLPVITCFPGHREYVPRFEEDIFCRIRTDLSHRQDAWRPKTDRKDCVVEAGAAIDMKGNALPGSVLVDDQLIEGGVCQSLPTESVQQFQGPVGERPDPGLDVKSLASVIVSVSVLLDPASEFILPGRAVDRFEQFGLHFGSDAASKMSKTRDGEFLRRKFEKHDASISLGRWRRRSRSRSSL